MDHYERSKLADAVKEEKYNPNDYVIKEVMKCLIKYCLGRYWKHILPYS